MKVVVTGGAGFIGNAVVLSLLNDDHDVFVIDRKSTKNRRLPMLVDGRGRFVEIIGDIRDAHIAHRIERISPDVLIHLAAQTSVVDSMEFPADDIDTNVTGTIRMYEAARRAGVGVFVNTASAAMYNAKSQYGMDKEFASRALALHQAGGMRVVELRPFNVYGPGRTGDIVSTLAEKCIATEPSVLYGEFSSRDYVYLDDVVRAYRLVAEDERAVGPYDVCTGVETTNRQVADRIAELTGYDLARMAIEAPRSGEIERSVGNPAPLWALGWRPEVSVETGIDRVVKQKRSALWSDMARQMRRAPTASSRPYNGVPTLLVSWNPMGTTGGINDHVWSYAQYLRRNGTPVMVVTGSRAPTHERRIYEKNGVRLVEEPGLSPMLIDWSPGDLPVTPEAVNRFRQTLQPYVDGFKPSVVHGFMLGEGNSNPLHALQQLSEQHAFKLFHTQYGEYGAHAAFGVDGIHHHFVASARLRIMATQQGVRAERLTISHPGIPLEQFSPHAVDGEKVRAEQWLFGGEVPDRWMLPLGLLDGDLDSEVNLHRQSLELAAELGSTLVVHSTKNFAHSDLGLQREQQLRDLCARRHVPLVFTPHAVPRHFMAPLARSATYTTAVNHGGRTGYTFSEAEAYAVGALPIAFDVRSVADPRTLANRSREQFDNPQLATAIRESQFDEVIHLDELQAFENYAGEARRELGHPFVEPPPLGGQRAYNLWRETARLNARLGTVDPHLQRSDRPLDAIFCYYSEGSANLAFTADLARSQNVPLFVLCSNADERRAAANYLRKEPVDCHAIDVSGVIESGLLHFESDDHPVASTANGDLVDKKRLLFMICEMLGYERVAAFDGDIYWTPDQKQQFMNDVKSIAANLGPEENDKVAISLSVDAQSDHDVAGYIFEYYGLKSPTPPSGGSQFMYVPHVKKTLVPRIYDEDYVMLADHIEDGRVAKHATIRQTEKFPFTLLRHPQEHALRPLLEASGEALFGLNRNVRANRKFKHLPTRSYSESAAERHWALRQQNRWVEAQERLSLDDSRAGQFVTISSETAVVANGRVNPARLRSYIRMCLGPDTRDWRTRLQQLPKDLADIDDVVRFFEANNHPTRIAVDRARESRTAPPKSARPKLMLSRAWLEDVVDRVALTNLVLESLTGDWNYADRNATNARLVKEVHAALEPYFDLTATRFPHPPAASLVEDGLARLAGADPLASLEYQDYLYPVVHEIQEYVNDSLFTPGDRSVVLSACHLVAHQRSAQDHIRMRLQSAGDLTNATDLRQLLFEAHDSYRPLIELLREELVAERTLQMMAERFFDGGGLNRAENLVSYRVFKAAADPGFEGTADERRLLWDTLFFGDREDRIACYQKSLSPSYAKERWEAMEPIVLNVG